MAEGANDDRIDSAEPERFVIKEKLGSGAVGVVYRAHDTVRGIDVALKVLKPARGPSRSSSSGAGEAERWARHIAREGLPWRLGLAHLPGAGAAEARGDTRAAIEALESACDRCDQTGMRLLSAVASHRRGALIGGERGDALRKEAADWMRSENVSSPERFVALFAPRVSRA